MAAGPITPQSLSSTDPLEDSATATSAAASVPAGMDRSGAQTLHTPVVSDYDMPGCPFDTKEEYIFQDHAIENHPASFSLFGKTLE